jgi:hypothetical protein
MGGAEVFEEWIKLVIVQRTRMPSQSGKDVVALQNRHGQAVKCSALQSVRFLDV